MKRLILALVLILPVTTQADEKTSICINVLQAGMYNGLLEDICGFKGGVKDKLKNMYAEGGCVPLISGEVIDAVSRDVTDDTYSRKNAMGEKAFCAGNKQAYNALK